MIDWGIEVDGKEPPGWDEAKDGCWFPDFAHQDYLYPYFNVGDQILDRYGRTEFLASDMIRLRDRMESLGKEMNHKPSVWTVADSSRAGDEAVMYLDRYKITALAKKTYEMIDRALEFGGFLVFRGD